MSDTKVAVNCFICGNLYLSGDCIENTCMSCKIEKEVIKETYVEDSVLIDYEGPFDGFLEYLVETKMKLVKAGGVELVVKPLYGSDYIFFKRPETKGEKEARKNEKKTQEAADRKKYEKLRDKYGWG